MPEDYQLLILRIISDPNLLALFNRSLEEQNKFGSGNFPLMLPTGDLIFMRKNPDGTNHIVTANEILKAKGAAAVTNAEEALRAGLYVPEGYDMSKQDLPYIMDKEMAYLLLEENSGSMQGLYDKLGEFGDFAAANNRTQLDANAMVDKKGLSGGAGLFFGSFFGGASRGVKSIYRNLASYTEDGATEAEELANEEAYRRKAKLEDSNRAVMGSISNTHANAFKNTNEQAWEEAIAADPSIANFNADKARWVVAPGFYTGALVSNEDRAKMHSLGTNSDMASALYGATLDEEGTSSLSNLRRMSALYDHSQANGEQMQKIELAVRTINQRFKLANKTLSEDDELKIIDNTLSRTFDLKSLQAFKAMRYFYMQNPHLHPSIAGKLLGQENLEYKSFADILNANAKLNSLDKYTIASNMNGVVDHESGLILVPDGNGGYTPLNIRDMRILSGDGRLNNRKVNWTPSRFGAADYGFANVDGEHNFVNATVDDNGKWIVPTDAEGNVQYVKGNYPLNFGQTDESGKQSFAFREIDNPGESLDLSSGLFIPRIGKGGSFGSIGEDSEALFESDKLYSLPAKDAYINDRLARINKENAKYQSLRSDLEILANGLVGGYANHGGSAPIAGKLIDWGASYSSRDIALMVDSGVLPEDAYDIALKLNDPNIDTKQKEIFLKYIQDEIAKAEQSNALLRNRSIGGRRSLGYNGIMGSYSGTDGELSAKAHLDGPGAGLWKLINDSSAENKRRGYTGLAIASDIGNLGGGFMRMANSGHYDAMYEEQKAKMDHLAMLLRKRGIDVPPHFQGLFDAEGLPTVEFQNALLTISEQDPTFMWDILHLFGSLDLRLNKYTGELSTTPEGRLGVSKLGEMNSDGLFIPKDNVDIQSAVADQALLGSAANNENTAGNLATLNLLFGLGGAAKTGTKALWGAGKATTAAIGSRSMAPITTGLRTMASNIRNGWIYRTSTPSWLYNLGKAPVHTAAPNPGSWLTRAWNGTTGFVGGVWKNTYPASLVAGPTAGYIANTVDSPFAEAMSPIAEGHEAISVGLQYQMHLNRARANQNQAVMAQMSAAPVDPNAATNGTQPNTSSGSDIDWGKWGLLGAGALGVGAVIGGLSGGNSVNGGYHGGNMYGGNYGVGYGGNMPGGYGNNMSGGYGGNMSGGGSSAPKPKRYAYY